LLLGQRSALAEIVSEGKKQLKTEKMNKKILLSLMIIGVVAGVTLGITGAYFTDDEPIEDNVFQAGTLDIQQGVNDLGNMTLSDLMPGVATAPQKLEMGNNGTLHAVIDKIEVTSLVNSDTSGNPGGNNVSADNYAAKVNTTISDEVGRPLWKGTLADLVGGNAVDGTDRVFLAKKGSGVNYTTRDYWFTFELDSNVDNTYQGEGVEATLTVNATQVKDDKFDAAERLVMNQNDGGGWDWVEDEDPTHADVSSHKSNLVGITAMGLLRAYEFSGNSDYFDSAEKAAYEIANHYIANYDGVKDADYERTKWEGGGAYSNPDILFLQRIGKYYNSGNLFSSQAEQAIVDRWNTYDNSAQDVYDWAKNARSSYPDLFYWDLAPLMEVTIDVANTISDSDQAMILRNNALGLAALVAADQDASGGWFIANWSNAYAQIGQASAVQILQTIDDADLGVEYKGKINKGVNALLSQQQGDGSFKGGTDEPNKVGSIQTTAYAAIALEMTGKHGAAEDAINYIISQQLSNGGWYEEEGTDEYPEVNSEALRAIVSVLE
jgi:predicted ribosomally synthesized peptide with SipW-like signal peptide